MKLNTYMNFTKAGFGDSHYNFMDVVSGSQCLYACSLCSLHEFVPKKFNHHRIDPGRKPGIVLERDNFMRPVTEHSGWVEHGGHTKRAVPPEIGPSYEEECIWEPQVRFVRPSDIPLYHSIKVSGDTHLLSLKKSSCWPACSACSEG